MKQHTTEIAVIGAGHAGIEAALAAARMGCRTVLFTMNLDAVGNMPCNPSIGGTGKGHLVFEIDALGGEMGRAADRVTLQSRTLNLGKGAAVHSKRVQADRFRYRELMKHTLEQTPNLRLIQAEITDLLTEEIPAKARTAAVGQDADTTVPEDKTAAAEKAATIVSEGKVAADLPESKGSAAIPATGNGNGLPTDNTDRAAGTESESNADGKTATAHIGTAAEAPEETVSPRRRVIGVRTSLGDEWYAARVIICSGTYLDSRVFVGHHNYASGPDGMLSASSLSASLAQNGVKLMRFKTGTPARINRRSIDFSKLDEQKGEETPVPFSSETDREEAKATARLLPCHIVYTAPETHKVILEHIKESAMYSGQITGTGPRYCPSIEDKLVRFADKPRHQLFVEPCGAHTDEMYLQGFSTSMPTDVQELMVHSLPGFENAEIMRYAYAIEYDCADPTQMDAMLAFKQIEGLYGAGQFNGTSGYEEAAAQGLVAGINAALAQKGEPPMVLTRDSSYIGTLIDDLVTKGTKEPYRIMTSRSEYRLLLRQDNADLRLCETGHRVGLLSETRYAAYLQKKAQTEAEMKRAATAVIPPTAEVNALLASCGSAPIVTGAKLADLLRRPELDYEKLAPVDPTRPADYRPGVLVTAQMQIKYEGYIRREFAEAKRHQKLENMLIPPSVDYKKLTGLRIEAMQKLDAIRPRSIGQAARISGVSPSDISVLLIYLTGHISDRPKAP